MEAPMPVGSGRSQSRNFLRNFNITVEPVLFCYFLASSLVVKLILGVYYTEATSTSILLSRSCLVVFNYSPENCTKMSSDVEQVVQEYTAKIIMVNTIMQSVFGAVMSVFVGPWSDSNGRKLFIILPTVGIIFQYALWLIFTYFPQLPPLYFILPSIPFAAVGGLTSLFTCVFCYIADITTERNRAFRMSVISLSYVMGVFLGYVGTAFIVKVFTASYTTILFCLAIFIMLMLLFYMIFSVQETIIFFEVTDERFIFSMFNYLTQMFKVLFLKRPAFGRMIIFSLASVHSIYVTVMLGESSLRYMAGIEKFSWSLEDYNVYCAVLCICSVTISSLFIMVLSKIMHIPDVIIALIVVLASIFSSVSISLSTTTLDFYISSILGVLISLLSPLVKSEIAQIVPRCDTGKLFAFLSTITAITPLVTSPIYTAVFNSFVDQNPLAIFLLSTVLWIFCWLIIIGIIVIKNIYGTSYSLENLENAEDQRTQLVSEPKETE